jgi:hypothetical protein
VVRCQNKCEEGLWFVVARPSVGFCFFEMADGRKWIPQELCKVTGLNLGLDDEH